MPLSRLDNFLKNVRGNIIYVDPNSLDATDSVTNQGNSAARPFITIQRALIEASRFSYQRGLDNDRFEKTTILLAPGDHFVDNRPGWIPNGSGNFKLRNGTGSGDFSQFNSNSNFNLNDAANDLYKFNSIHGGVIVPRGVSIVGQDLRKCKIRPKYVPNPINDNIERSSIFKITGATYFQSFTVLDAKPTDNIFKDYTVNTYTPDFSHHKLTAFEYVDGKNETDISDVFLTYYTTRTDLDMYYEKVGIAYGPASGREIQPDYPSANVDLQAKIDEYRIVGPISGQVGISSIKAGDGTTATKVITATLDAGISGLNVDTRVQIEGIAATGYDGTYPVTNVLTEDSDGNATSFTYEVPTIPVNALPSATAGSVVLSSDTVSSASPYIFNISMRSVYGMCGMHADGSKVLGFKSMVVAQFTGVSLQTDDNAFVKYNPVSGTYDDSTTISNLHSDGGAKYKPSYSNFHIKASNNGFIQLVSIFAIGFSNQFTVESGGDFSVTNSNSNFGQNALKSSGFRNEAFIKDDVGYITHVVPPRAVLPSTVNLEYNSIDVSRTVGVANTSRLYLYNQTNENSKPNSTLQGYRIGSKLDEDLNVLISRGGTPTGYRARVIMPNTEYTSTEVTSVKVANVGRNVSTGNSISSSTITFTDDHQFINGETIRFFSDNSRLPDGLTNNQIYYAITTGVNADQIKVAQTPNDAENATAITINNLGGNLSVESRVSDKIAGDIGHPIQYDSTVNQWYVTVGTAATANTIYPTIVSLGTTALGDATSRTYITRQPDTRASSDRIFKYRYVIPAGSGITSARVPSDNFVIQESNDVTGSDNTEVALQFSPTTVSMSNVSEMRNFSFISNAVWNGGANASYTTELPHNLSIGSTVTVSNVTSSNFPVGTANSGFNGTFRVTGITSAREFRVNGLSDNPGSFSNDVSQRTTSLPTFKRNTSNNNYFVYESEQVKEYVPGEQDGIYYLTILNASNSPTVAPFNSNDFNYSQPLQNLYPQFDRDNPNSNPKPSKTYALPNKLGQVVTSEPKNSITRETLDKKFLDSGIGVGIVNIVSNTAGTAHTITFDRDHGLNAISAVTVSTAGAGYGNGTGGTEQLYDAALVRVGTGGDYATARITVNSSGQITGAKIMSGGSNYSVGDVLNVTGTATTTGFSQGQVTVSQIINNVGDTLSVAGVTSTSYQAYNQLYRITGISSTFNVQAASVSAVGQRTVSGIGITLTANSYARLTGPKLDITSIDYNNVTGIATVKTTQAHGLRPNNAIQIGGASNNFFNKEFIVTQNVGLTTFQVNVGVSTLSPTASGTLRGYYTSDSAQEGNIRVIDENFGGRVSDIYAGITTVLSAAVTSTTGDEISITNVTNFNFNIGDYLRIDDEIVRVKTTVTGNPVRVFRGVFGTNAATHINGSVVKKIAAKPIEFRRNSIIRASGHTFEYIGFGPGNYSTAFPDKQSGELTFADQLKAQSQTTNAGVSNYTGMNDTGDFFIGNKKITAVTGKEELYDTPIQSYTGDDIYDPTILGNSGIDVISPLEANVSRSITVDGGQNNDVLSRFNGPVVFSEKLTSTSSRGIEANSIFLQGDATVSRNYTVGVATPVTAGNPGDVVFNANPVEGDTVGWTYTTDNAWYPFGGVSLDQTSNVFIFDKVGVGTTTPGDATFKVGSGTSQFTITGNGEVGIGTSFTSTGAKVQVQGAVVATAFTGDGSGLFNLFNDSLWQGVGAGLGTGIYPVQNLNVGIGTTIPNDDYFLQIGSVGTGGTDLFVTNQSQFSGTVKIDTANVSGIITASGFDLQSSSGKITAGVVTTTTLRVGSGSTIMSATSSGVGIGTLTPRAQLDVEGAARFKQYYEMPVPVTVSSNNVDIDVTKGQTFTLTSPSTNVSQFTLLNVPASSSTAFTLQIVQGSTGRQVGIDTFRTSGGSAIPVRWPGGVVPIVTSNASAIDVYSFITFDGGSTLYGVVGGQNFS